MPKQTLFEQIQILSRQPLDFLLPYLEENCLEIGCGRGANLHYLANRHPVSDFIGIDNTPTRVQAAQIRNRNLSNVYIEQSSLHALPYGDENFSSVYCVDRLGHTLNAPKSLGEAYRVLRPGGRLAVINSFDTPTDPCPVNCLAPDLENWLSMAEKAGFTREVFEKFEKISKSSHLRGFLSRPRARKAAEGVLSMSGANGLNHIARKHACGYYLVVCQKPKDA